MARASMTPAEIAAKWSRNLQNNKESMRKGAEAVTVAPGELAAKEVDRYKSGVIEAADSGRWAAAVRSVSREDWLKSYLDKGLKNLDNGLKEGEKKMTKFQEEFQPVTSAIREKVSRMPKGGRANAMARITENLDALEQFKKNRRR